MAGVVFRERAGLVDLNNQRVWVLTALQGQETPLHTHIIMAK